MVVALATVFGGIGYVIFLIGETQLASLVQRMPELIARLQSRADALAASYPWFDVDGTFSKAPTAAKLVGAKIFHGAWSGFGLRSEEGRVGKEGGRTCGLGWSTDC